MERCLTQQSKKVRGKRVYGKKRGTAVVLYWVGGGKYFISNKIISLILSIHHTTIKHNNWKRGGEALDVLLPSSHSGAIPLNVKYLPPPTVFLLSAQLHCSPLHCLLHPMSVNCFFYWRIPIACACSSSQQHYWLHHCISHHHLSHRHLSASPLTTLLPHSY